MDVEEDLLGVVKLVIPGEDVDEGEDEGEGGVLNGDEQRRIVFGMNTVLKHRMRQYLLGYIALISLIFDTLI